MKIIVAHPFKQHSFNTAIGFAKHEDLFRYITTVYLRRGNITDLIYRHASKQNRARAESHSSNTLNPYTTQFCEIEGLFYTALLRLPKLKKLARIVKKHLVTRFGKKVAKYSIKNSVDAVLMYDCTAKDCFKRIRKSKSGIVCVLDMSACTVPSRIRDYENDPLFEKYFGTQEVINNWGRPSEYSQLYLDELIYADFFIVASERVKEDLKFRGIDSNKIYIIPYGVKDGVNSKEKPIIGKPLKLLCASGLSFQKGVHHLLNAVKKLPADAVELSIVGDFDSKSPLFYECEQMNNTYLLGRVPSIQMNEIYSKNDVLIMPSLNDGYGLVVIEAMSHGLPVIVSNHAGSCSAVTNAYNGFVYDAYDENELKNDILYLINNSEVIPEMSKNAINTCREYSLEKYYDRIDAILRKALAAREES